MVEWNKLPTQRDTSHIITSSENALRISTLLIDSPGVDTRICAGIVQGLLDW